MFFLVDRQLPPRLSVWLRERGHKAMHVDELTNGSTMPDGEIWRRARVGLWVIVSRDYDFHDLLAVTTDAPPPQILHVAIGNCSNKELISIVGEHWEHIESLLQRGQRLVTVPKPGQRPY